MENEKQLSQIGLVAVIIIAFALPFVLTVWLAGWGWAGVAWHYMRQGWGG